MRKIVALACALALLCAGCAGKTAGSEAPRAKTLAYRAEGVEEFLAALAQSGTQTSALDGACMQITPDDVLEVSDFRVFQFADSFRSFLLCEGAVYELGESLGGRGVVDMALGDLNGDGTQELYYTYSWGSGMHRSHAAYFDSAAKRSVELDFVLLDEDMMLWDGGNGALALYEAELSLDGSSGALLLSPAAQCAQIVCEDGVIRVKE